LKGLPDKFKNLLTTETPGHGENQNLYPSYPVHQCKRGFLRVSVSLWFEYFRGADSVIMKFIFRYLLAFESVEGLLNVAEFGNYDDYKDFAKGLEAQGLSHRLINPVEFKSPTFKDANYLDLT